MCVYCYILKKSLSTSNLTHLCFIYCVHFQTKEFPKKIKVMWSVILRLQLIYLCWWMFLKCFFNAFSVDSFKLLRRVIGRFHGVTLNLSFCSSFPLSTTLLCPSFGYGRNALIPTLCVCVSSFLCSNNGRTPHQHLPSLKVITVLLILGSLADRVFRPTWADSGSGRPLDCSLVNK